MLHHQQLLFNSIFLILILFIYLFLHRPNQIITSKSFQFQSINGFFLQDQINQHPIKFKVYHPNSSFGLIDNQSPDRWTRFQTSINRLIHQQSPFGVKYKVIFIARHGQGFHNVAESKYGTVLWDCHWSEKSTDGDLIWGPDARLTGLGKSEAKEAHHAWARELREKAPLPQLFISSPLSRAIETMFITGTFNSKDYYNSNQTLGPRIIIKENWRENIGLHTCDQRRAKQEIANDFKSVEFEDEFSEQDLLWTRDFQETNKQLRIRIHQALTSLFLDPISTNLTYISITAHSGVISALLDVVNHQPWPTQTGGMIPMVIRATPSKTPTNPPSPGPSATRPKCPSTTASHIHP